MSARRLLLDAGNTRLKWAVALDGRWQDQGSATYADLAALAPVLAQAKGVRCFVASVAGAPDEQRIAALLASFGIAPVWLAAQAECAGVVNGYANPRQLGVDRWMGLIAARARSRSPTLVVSAGTAMTVDALSADGTFMGGLIVPGMAMMRESLRLGTARVSGTDGVRQAFPRCTADAVQSGILAALCGAIRQQYEALAESAGSPPRCLISGGDAPALLPCLTVPAEHAPALVLEGIDHVTRRQASA